MVQTEAREIRVEARPPRLSLGEKIKTRITNDSKKKIWLKTVCGTPFYRARKKEDAWETQYEPFPEAECQIDSVAIAPGASRHFVIGNLGEFEDSSGTPVGPGSYRFELTYTDGDDSFLYHAIVYSTELDLVPTLSQR
ncbi:MAG: hypothetical protein AMJ62_12095 [Myxococcales bacterium SG8_38]|nr:MAG: hypothetical protein AMJ62_12095 [Myxococcales bacterium SG8_38]